MNLLQNFELAVSSLANNLCTCLFNFCARMNTHVVWAWFCFHSTLVFIIFIISSHWQTIVMHLSTNTPTRSRLPQAARQRPTITTR